MSGEMRRPPQLWEQRLARTTSVIAAGVSSGEATAIVTPTPPPGTDGGVEPSPVLPPPGDFIAPSTPTLIGSVQGINVVWNGLNSAGDLWPSDTSYVEVHMDTSGTATLGTATLKGRLARPGGLAVTGLSAGTTYYFRLRGADPAGNVTAASTAASGQTGLINAPDIAANAITANSIVAGTITGWDINAAYLSGGTISGGFITGGTVSGGFISGGTVDGGLLTGVSIRTAGSGARVELGNTFGIISAARFFTVAGDHGTVGAGINVGEILINPVDRTQNNGDLLVNGEVDCDSFVVSGVLDANGNSTFGASGGNAAFRVQDDDVYSYGIDDNTTANAANVRVGASAQLLRSTSTVRLKDELAPLDGDLAGVPVEKLTTELPSVDPYDVLTLTPTEFRSLSPADGDARSLGFIAEDVAIKFPWAADWDEEGLPSAVEDRPILAALVAVVKDQAATITDLRSRIEALEA
jgi:hypothetical protein